LILTRLLFAEHFYTYAFHWLSRQLASETLCLPTLP